MRLAPGNPLSWVRALQFREGSAGRGSVWGGRNYECLNFFRFVHGEGLEPQFLMSPSTKRAILLIIFDVMVWIKRGLSNKRLNLIVFPPAGVR